MNIKKRKPTEEEINLIQVFMHERIKYEDNQCCGNFKTDEDDVLEEIIAIKEGMSLVFEFTDYDKIVVPVISFIEEPTGNISMYPETLLISNGCVFDISNIDYVPLEIDRLFLLECPFLTTQLAIKNENTNNSGSR